jgi:hypothetical protein
LHRGHDATRRAGRPSALIRSDATVCYFRQHLGKWLGVRAYLQPFVARGHFGKPSAVTASGREPLLAVDDFVPANLPSGPVQNYDFRNGAINVNVFVRYEYLPLSAIWLVYTYSQTQTGYDPAEGPGRIRFDQFAGGPTTDVLLLKLSYLWF